MITLQCQRVDTLLGGPERGSKMVNCALCGAPVFISNKARDLFGQGGYRILCEVCQPAAPVGHLESG